MRSDRYKKKPVGPNTTPHLFRNVALLPEDHDRLKTIASEEQRTMTRQLSVIIRREYDKREIPL